MPVAFLALALSGLTGLPALFVYVVVLVLLLITAAAWAKRKICAPNRPQPPQSHPHRPPLF